MTASEDAQLSASELLALIGGGPAADDQARCQAIACYLAAGEGWKDAAKRLGGAFASDCGTSGLKGAKAE